MKKRNIIFVLVLTIVIGVGATAYAATNSTSTAGRQRLGLGRVTSMRGYDFISNILKNKLGLSETDISNATSSGKTLYELATEKGMTEEQFKAALLEEKTNAIDTAVSKGTITKDEGETLKANVSSNIANCTGNFNQCKGLGLGQGQGRGRGLGRGMMGNR